MVKRPKKSKFRTKTLYQWKRAPETLQYLKQKSSFWIASLSILAFIAGNMLGNHGWYAFWKAVMGGFDDSLITYNGTIVPIAFIPDPKYQTGENPLHYRDLPQEILIPLPMYNTAEQRNHEGNRTIYSIGHMGSYETGTEGDGSHPGVDIRVPEGTPVRSIANGIVTQVQNNPEGYGKLIVIRHPHIPDPENPQKETILHSVYAHLSAQFVIEGEVVQKGQEIGLAGSSGFVTGPHLHFQIDRDNAPWHPYWPFTATEARDAGWTLTEAINNGLHNERGLAHTVNPLLFVQANFPAISDTSVAITKGENVQTNNQSQAITTEEEETMRTVVQLLSRREQRAERRMARQRFVEKQLVALHGQTDAPTNGTVSIENTENSVRTVESVAIEHDGIFREEEWETIHLTLTDASGNIVEVPNQSLDLQLQTGYGEAKFEPSVLSELDFQKGKVEIRMLPLSTRTIVLHILPFEILSKPFRPESSLKGK